MSFNMQNKPMEITCPNCNKKIKEKSLGSRESASVPTGAGLFLIVMRLHGVSRMQRIQPTNS